MKSADLETGRLPHHVAIIMDGNGRWAERRGSARVEGHKEGAKSVRRIVTAARRLGIGALTLYAFSEQNWLRPEGEVEALMGLLCEFLEGERATLLQNRIRLRAVGNLRRLPEEVRAALEAVCTATNESDGMTLTLALSYGGREEIADAARALAMEVASGRLRLDDVTCDALQGRMPSLDVGAPDLVIRTGGEQRISNFLLYGLSYAELYFTSVHWPDFSEKDLIDAIASYESRQRRFGKVVDAEGAAPPKAQPHPFAISALPLLRGLLNPSS